MAGKLKRYLLISVLVAVVLLAAVGFGLVPVNLFFAKPAISDFVSQKLGMDLEIHGPLRIRFGPAPALTASGITLRHRATDGEPLVRMAQLDISPRLLDVLDGDLFFRRISATGVEIDYCQGAPPNASASSGSGDNGEAPPSFAIDRLRLRNIRPVCSNQERVLAFLPQQLEIEASVPRKGPIDASVAAGGDESRIQLTLSSGSLAELLEDSAGISFELQLQALESEIAVSGNISTPLSDPEISVRAELVSDQLELMTGNRSIFFNGLARGFSSSPYFEIDAELQQLDLQWLLEAAEAPGDNEEPMNFRPVYELLAPIQARASIRIERLLNAPLPVRELVLEASLAGGVLDLNKADLLLAGSPLAARASLDMRGTCARLTSGLKISNFRLDQLNRVLADGGPLGGRLAQADLGSTSCGDTLAEHVDSLQMTVTASGLEGSWDEQKLPLDFHSLQAGINWREPGHLSFDGELLGESLSASASFGSIESMQPGIYWPLKIDARGDASRLTLEGKAGVLENTLDFDVNMNFEALQFGSLHAWIGSNPANTLALRGKASMALGEGGLSIDDLDVTLGASDFRGSMSWARPDSELPIALTLRSNKLDIDELSGLFPETEEPEGAERPEWAELLTQSEWLEEWLEVPPLDIDLSVKQVNGLKFDLADTALRFILRDRQIRDGQLNLLLEGIAAEGKLNASLRERPWTVAYESNFSNIDIGWVLEAFGLAENVDAHAQRASFLYTSEGDSLKQLAENSLLDSTIEALRWTFNAGPENQRQEFDLARLDLKTAPASASHWVASGFLNDVPIKAWMESPPLWTTFNPAAQFPLTLVIGTGGDIMMIDAVIDRRDRADRHVSLSVSGDFNNHENLDLSQLQPPLKDYNIRADVAIKEDELLFSQIQAQIGSSLADGRIDIRFEDPDYDFDIEINSSFLETEDFVKWAEDWRNTQRLLSSEDPAETAPEAVEGGILAVIGQSIAEFAGSNDFDVRIGIDELRSFGHLLGEARLDFKLLGDELMIDRLQITSPAGKAEASFHGKAIDAGIEYKLDVEIEQLEYGGLLRLLDPESQTHGKLYLESSLISRSPGPAQGVNHLQGTFNLALFPEDVMAGFLDLWASNLIFALLPDGAERGKKLNCMVALFEVENGVMKSKNTFLDSTNVIVRAQGDIDLVNHKLDLLIAPQSKREKFLSVSTPIEVTGPFSDFSIAVAPGGFLTTMFRWYYGLIYVPWKRLTGERFPADGIATCYTAMGWDLPGNLQ